MSGLGGFIHERIMLDQIESGLRSRGFTVVRQAKVARTGRAMAHTDLLAMKNGITTVVEVELTPRRVDRDLAKADALRADELWIVVPRRAVAIAVRHKLCSLNRLRTAMRIRVLTFGQALQHVEHLFPLISAANVEGK